MLGFSMTDIESLGDLTGSGVASPERTVAEVEICGSISLLELPSSVIVFATGSSVTSFEVGAPCGPLGSLLSDTL